MVIDYNKSYALTVTYKKLLLYIKFHVEDSHINNVNEVKYFGLTLNTKVNFEGHLDKMRSKNRKLCFLRRKLGNCHWLVKLSSYKILVRRVLEYASVVWDPYLGK